MGRGLLGYGISILDPNSLKFGALARVLGCGLTLDAKKWWLVGQIAFWGVTYEMDHGGVVFRCFVLPQNKLLYRHHLPPSQECIIYNPLGG